MDSAESVGLCKSNFALNNILRINQLRNSSNDKIEPMETVLNPNKEWRNNAEDMWKVKDTLNQSNKNKFLQPRPAMSGTQKGVITSLDTSARKITIKTKLKIWSQRPEHPTCGHGATWAPGVRELLEQHLEQRKKTVFVLKL